MNKRGVTLVELIVVISIIGILVIALGFSYVGWQGAYKVEKVTKELYTDLMNARGMAMTRNRNYFVDFPTTTSYRASADTAAVNNFALEGDGFWDADGNGILDPVHTVLPTFPKTVEYVINENLTGNTITFDKRGLVSPNGSIWFTSTADPDYDCIVIFTTRINIGKWDGANCNAK